VWQWRPPASELLTNRSTIVVHSPWSILTYKVYTNSDGVWNAPGKESDSEKLLTNYRCITIWRSRKWMNSVNSVELEWMNDVNSVNVAPQHCRTFVSHRVTLRPPLMKRSKFFIFFFSDLPPISQRVPQDPISVTCALASFFLVA